MTELIHLIAFTTKQSLIADGLLELHSASICTFSVIFVFILLWHLHVSVLAMLSSLNFSTGSFTPTSKQLPSQ